MSARKFLKNLRTTSSKTLGKTPEIKTETKPERIPENNMSEPLKIAVIGAGLIGLSCADALLRSSAKGAVAVTIFEQRSAPVRGTSFCNSGMIHPSQSQSWASDGQTPDKLTLAASQSVFDLANLTRRLLLDNAKRLKLTDMLSRPKGCLQIYADIDDVQKAQKGFESLGIKSAIHMDPVTTFGHPALLFPDDISGNARLYGEALAADLKARGAALIYNADKINFRPQNDGVMIGLTENGFSKQGREHFDHVIMAVGPQSPSVMASLGLSIQIDPVRGHAVNYAKPDMALPDMPLMDVASRSALTVFKDHIRLSGTWDVEDNAVLLNRWKDIAPQLMDKLEAPVSSWTGLRPVSRAGRPYISSTSIERLWINTGHGHLGWTLCAGSGELMARMILDGETDKRFIYAG